MDMRKAAAIAGIAIAFLIVEGAGAQSLDRTGSLSLSTNPMKLAMGMANLEVQYAVHPGLSFYVFAEGLLFDYAVSRTAHPDFVVEAGPRWHMLPAVRQPAVFDLSLGMSAGWTWSAGSPSMTGFKLNAELGCAYLFYGPFFAMGKGILTWTPCTGRVFPGFEIHLGGLLL
jgi:hypothetical protein